MKKTKYIMIVSCGVGSGTEKYRRVWQDKNGNYFVKRDRKIINVNHAKEYFVEE